MELGRGYVAWATVGDEFFFEHVDSCCALAVVMADGTMVGGHVPQQWDAQTGVDCAANLRNIYSLIDVTRRNHAGGGAVTGLIGVGPVMWRVPYGVILGELDPVFSLEFPSLFIATDAAVGGVDVKITSTPGGVGVYVRRSTTNDYTHYPMATETDNKIYQ